MIIVLGRVVVRSAALAEALALSQEHVVRSRGEPGCIAHAVHRDTENADCLVFVEQWSDAAALQTHFKVPASRTFVKALAALATGAPSMSVFTAAPVQL